MTETCTNKLNLSGKHSTDDTEYCNKLNYHEEQFYQIIASKLDRMQVFPKEKTVQKIIAYSRSKK